MKELFKENKVCAIMRNVPLNLTLKYATAAYEGGIRMFEVAVNSDHAYDQIRTLSHEFGKDIMIGAGTVISPIGCEKSIEAGAQFFLTPSTNRATIEFCIEGKIPILPGVMTPTDVDICQSYGIDTMKLFPAGDLPKGYIKSLKGPFDDTDYIAVGGVSTENVHDFFQNGYIGVGIGSNLIPNDLMSTGDWKKASKDIEKMMNSIKNYKSNI